MFSFVLFFPSIALAILGSYLFIYCVYMCLFPYEFEVCLFATISVKNYVSIFKVITLNLDCFL